MNLENIRTLAKASGIIYETYMEDSLVAPGDANALGNTLQDKIIKHELTDQEITAISIWDKFIDVKIPPDNLMRVKPHSSNQ